MAWYDLLRSWMDGFWDNIDKIKSALWSWVDDIAQYWIRNITSVSGAIDSIKNALWSWVDGIAKYWVQRADEFFDILHHSWSDVYRVAQETARNVVRGADEFFDILKHTWDDILDAVEGAKDYAAYLVTDLAQKVDKWISDIGGTIADVWANLKPYVESYIAGIVESVERLLEDMANIKTWIDSFTDNIRIVLGDIAGDILNALTALGDGFVKAVLNMDVPYDDLIEELQKILKE